MQLFKFWSTRISGIYFFDSSNRYFLKSDECSQKLIVCASTQQNQAVGKMWVGLNGLWWWYWRSGWNDKEWDTALNRFEAPRYGLADKHQTQRSRRGWLTWRCALSRTLPPSHSHTSPLSFAPLVSCSADGSNQPCRFQSTVFTSSSVVDVICLLFCQSRAHLLCCHSFSVWQASACHVLNAFLEFIASYSFIDSMASIKRLSYVLLLPISWQHPFLLVYFIT